MKYIKTYEKKTMKISDLKKSNNTLYTIANRFKNLLSEIKKLEITEENKTTLNMRIDSYEKIIIDYNYYSDCLFEIVLYLDFDYNYRLDTVIQVKSVYNQILYDLINSIFNIYMIYNSNNNFGTYIIPSDKIIDGLTNLEKSFYATINSEKFNL